MDSPPQTTKIKARYHSVALIGLIFLGVTIIIFYLTVFRLRLTRRLNQRFTRGNILIEKSETKNLTYQPHLSLKKNKTAGETLIFFSPPNRIRLNAEELSNKNNYNGAPIDHFEIIKAPNEKGIAILIPQSHRYPGSSIADAVNDNAEQVQTDIYNIIYHLYKNFDIRMVMVEGEPKGAIATTTLSRIFDHNEQNKQLIEETTELRQQARASNMPLSRALLNLANDLTQKQRQEQRAIILAGAAQKLVADGMPLSLVGSENSDTIAAGATIVRDYIYLTDRIQQLTTVVAVSPSNVNNNQDFSESINLPSLTQLISKLNSPENLLSVHLKTAETLSYENGAATSTQLLGRIATTLSRLQENQSIPTNATLTNQLPSRADNPYVQINSVPLLRAKLTAIENKIQDVVVEKRNREAAEYFSDALGQASTAVGIIQFGAGHEDGLTRELTARGLTVIILTPNHLVSKR